nr:hypothetical protein [Tsukamurella pseudospumae]
MIVPHTSANTSWREHCEAGLFTTVMPGPLENQSETMSDMIWVTPPSP